jgi:hypothetical protein
MKIIIQKKGHYLFLLTLLIIAVQLVIVTEGRCNAGTKKPTAIVIDDETGEPIEGAVAIAIWRKHTYKDRWFEGGNDVVVKIEEAVSDKEGKIYIDGFFGLYLFSQEPHLTIYKFGYVCWDQGNIYINEKHAPRRNDFDKNNRIARLNKWPNEFSFVGHESFIDSVVRDFAEAPKKLFLSAIRQEDNLRIKERTKEEKMQFNNNQNGAGGKNE